MFNPNSCNNLGMFKLKNLQIHKKRRSITQPQKTSTRHLCLAVLSHRQKKTHPKRSSLLQKIIARHTYYRKTKPRHLYMTMRLFIIQQEKKMKFMLSIRYQIEFNSPFIVKHVLQMKISLYIHILAVRYSKEAIYALRGRHRSAAQTCTAYPKKWEGQGICILSQILGCLYLMLMTFMTERQKGKIMMRKLLVISSNGLRVILSQN